MIFSLILCIEEFYFHFFSELHTLSPTFRSILDSREDAATIQKATDVVKNEVRRRTHGAFGIKQKAH